MDDLFISPRQKRRVPRGLRILWVLLLFAGLLGALFTISAILMHHPSRLRYRILALMWVAGAGGLALIAAMGWSALHETDDPRSW